MKTQFFHKGLTLAEAVELVQLYANRKKTATRELDPVTQTWTVSVWLHELNYLPRSKIAGAGMWGLL